MSDETWWMLTWAKTGEIIEVFRGEPLAYCHNVAFTLTRVRIVPVGTDQRDAYDVYIGRGGKVCPSCGQPFGGDE